ncbi:hypothetical protein M409DRAFT_29950 [Zasmidium cellare ATCC 36951]|uniref:aminodeoxychorismate synthase n=1 Tax=Zasmidium cellare ATCC 36951 TaxID=1080233 RepID=A0A6A6BXW3_ZASCE|nr:uncharacterized protein M409DRAFT_29950 [Zasmidium cellare ATCC 36951]KAF2159631.1 hypothetical protein M409DRAFT_29950 [Zasmidium cellare ATCC 36951]
MQRQRILFIDAYDSFSNSIIALLRAELSVTVESIRIDDPRFVLNDEAFFTYLDGFHAVVAGPGPGHPANAEDVGLIGKLWDLPDEHVLPVLGICLGFQSLCAAFGGHVARLREPRHGIMAMVTHRNKSVFSGAGKVIATQYHSLHVQLEKGEGEVWEPTELWKPSETCPELVPLAWDLMSVKNGPILMGVQHAKKPLWGVQYHPESICTNKEGQRLISRWWEEVMKWSSMQGRVSGTEIDNRIDTPTEDVKISPAMEAADSPRRNVLWSTVEGVKLPDVADLVEVLKEGIVPEEPLILESGSRNGKPVNPETGRFSIIALPEASSMHIRYSTARHSLQMVEGGVVSVEKQADVRQTFSFIDDCMRSRKASNGPVGSPFWGGLVGFISYEAGLESIDVPPSVDGSNRPDLWFVFVERSAVLDHVDGVVYVQSLRGDDEEWMESVKSAITRCGEEEGSGVSKVKVSAELVDGPEVEEYCSKVRRCQAELRAGESYELCLTDQSTLKIQADAWSIYRQLRSRNPAPFGAYLRLEGGYGAGLSVAGSSPERFLSWSRSGTCQFRPIKGTVKKGPGITRAKAEEVLGSAKERAENLMIVDLIRHDLAGVPGVDAVRVPKLMTVEEYETVFQLTSVIEGDVQAPASPIAALAASLPPGSMTGAPKKRSCEILKEIEGGKPRGLYSGVVGFFDVGGGGDFSVVIRTAFKWDDDGDSWRVGAGGAITALSEADAEWEEMVTKRESVLKSLS